ncbi:hypothetical protein ACLB2K_006931 [Fragaria x ananassa]
MENLLGLLRIHIQRGVDLAVRDMTSSDPYIIVKMGKQKLKTSVVKRNVNPEWNEKLTLTVSDPNIPVKLFVYDKDTFTFDDKMGDAEFEIATFVKVLQMRLEGLPEGTIIARVQPTRQNCLAEESCIIWSNGKVVQNMVLRLRNVERGELELQLQWIHVPMESRAQGTGYIPDGSAVGWASEGATRGGGSVRLGSGASEASGVARQATVCGGCSGRGNDGDGIDGDGLGTRVVVVGWWRGDGRCALKAERVTVGDRGWVGVESGGIGDWWLWVGGPATVDAHGWLSG